MCLFTLPRCSGFGCLEPIYKLPLKYVASFKNGQIWPRKSEFHGSQSLVDTVKEAEAVGEILKVGNACEGRSKLACHPHWHEMDVCDAEYVFISHRWLMMSYYLFIMKWFWLVLGKYIFGVSFNCHVQSFFK